MGYWKTKVLPKIKKVFETKNSVKKVAAAEACKTFDGAKEEYSKEFEEKKADLQPKVVEIYEASSSEFKALVKEPKDAGLKKYSAEVEKFFDELSKIEFPGSKPVYEACTNYGPSYVPGPISFVFEKVSTFIAVEEKKEEEAPAAAAEEAAAPAEETGEETSCNKDKEIVIEEEKKEEVVTVVEAEKIEPAPAPPAAEPPKAEEVAPAEPPKP